MVDGATVQITQILMSAQREKEAETGLRWVWRQGYRALQRTL